MGAVFKSIWDRVVGGYKSTLIGLAFGVGIIAVDSLTPYLQSLPQGWAKALAMVVVLAGSYMKGKALPPAPPPAAPVV